MINTANYSEKELRSLSCGLYCKISRVEGIKNMALLPF